MNRTAILVIFTLLFGVVGGYLLEKVQQRNEDASTSKSAASSTPQATKNNCLADECLLNGVEYPVTKLPTAVKDSLNQALMDEYKAYATYKSVMDEFGNIKPFIMIARAEQQHIVALQGIYEKYGVTIPENTLLGTIPALNSIRAACALGVQGEIDNIKLYKESLLPTVNDYEDITIIFTNLMNASEKKHLPAFQRCD